MLTIENVKSFCFDTLGDLVNPKNIEVEQTRSGKIQVIVLRTGGVPKEVIRDDWNRAAKGTELESVALFL